MSRLLTVSVLVAFLANCSAAPESSPLATLGRLDSAEITVRESTGGVPLHSVVVRGSATLADLRTFAGKRGDWRPRDLGTDPAGDVRVALYSDGAYVGVVSAGGNWIGARDAEGNARFRSMTAEDSLRIAQIRAVK